jgi:hypothetical protein
MSDKKIEEFITLTDSDADVLSIKVNSLLKQGWTLHGETTSTGMNSGSWFGSSSVTYGQAMILYEGDYKQISEKDKESFEKELRQHSSGCLSFIIIGAGLFLHFFF